MKILFGPDPDEDATGRDGLLQAPHRALITEFVRDEVLVLEGAVGLRGADDQLPELTVGESGRDRRLRVAASVEHADRTSGYQQEPASRQPVAEAHPPES